MWIGQPHLVEEPWLTIEVRFAVEGAYLSERGADLASVRGEDMICVI